MEWVTAVWAMLMWGCVATALMHLLVGIWQRRVTRFYFILPVRKEIPK